MEGHPQIVYKKRSFLSQLVLGVSIVSVAVIASGTAVVLYGMKIMDEKTGDFLGFAETTLRGLPEIRKSLPPVLVDMLNDRRLPDYRHQIEVSARLASGTARRGSGRVIVEVTNNGTELVSLLSFRIVGIDPNGEPSFERSEWAATPIAADHDWPGPLMPGARRFLTTNAVPIHDASRDADMRFEIEITDIRVWEDDSARGESL